MAIDLRACTGLPIPCPKRPHKVYDLPPLSALHAALSASRYAAWGYVMLYGGLRVGEPCLSQTIHGDVLYVDRRRTVKGALASAKTCGPVVLPDWLARIYAPGRVSPSRGIHDIDQVMSGRCIGSALGPLVPNTRGGRGRTTTAPSSPNQSCERSRPKRTTRRRARPLAP
jgi:hypothetical protein